MAQVTEWEGPDLWNLLSLPNAELYRLYGAYLDKHSIRRTANKYRKLYHNGEINMPEREKPYNPDTEPLEIANRRSKAAKTLGPKALETTVLTIPTDHLPYHEKLQEHLDAEGAVSKMRVSEYQMGYKDADGEAQSHDLKAMRFEVAFNTEPQWPIVSRVESVRLPKRERSEKDKLREGKRAIILPDLQIPFQDEQAVQIALQVMADVKPDKVVIVGDLLDLSAWSKFLQRPEWANQTQESIIQAHQLLATIRKLCPTAEIAVLEGNHDLRMNTHVQKNAAAALGLKRADQLEHWPVMSVPYLCAFDTLDVEYISGYPANRYWLNENLQVRHGNKVRSGASTARAISDDERVSTIFGHTHRLETHYKTKQTYDGGKINAAFSPGCLCRIDGTVPGANTGYDLDGKTVENYENWQQGLMVVDYEEGDGAFYPQQVFINSFNNYQTRFNGKTYEAKQTR